MNMTSQQIPKDTVQQIRQHTLDVVKRYHLAWRERDLEGILGCYHPDIQYHDFFQNKVFTQADIERYIRASLPCAVLNPFAHIRADGDTAFIEFTIPLKGKQSIADCQGREDRDDKAG